jgi:hypothetical protein
MGAAEEQNSLEPLTPEQVQLLKAMTSYSPGSGYMPPLDSWSRKYGGRSERQMAGDAYNHLWGGKENYDFYVQTHAEQAIRAGNRVAGVIHLGEAAGLALLDMVLPWELILESPACNKFGLARFTGHILLKEAHKLLGG